MGAKLLSVRQCRIRRFQVLEQIHGLTCVFSYCFDLPQPQQKVQYSSVLVLKCIRKVENYADFVAGFWGEDFASGCFYDSEFVRTV